MRQREFLYGGGFRSNLSRFVEAKVLVRSREVRKKHRKRGFCIWTI